MGNSIVRAARSNDIENVKRIINDKKCDINLTDSSGANALFYAIHNNNIEMCELLIDANININLQDKKLDTPLIWACCKKRENIIKLLLGKGADTSLRNEENKTAFDYSKKFN